MNDVVKLLTETAESEVKKWGGSEVGLLHLAVALSKRSPQAFEAAFGDEGLELVTARLQAKEFGSTDKIEQEQVLASADGQYGDDAYQAISTALRARLDWVYEPPEATEAPDTIAPLTDQADVSDPTPAAASTSADNDALVPVDFGDDRRGERAAQVDELLVMLGRRTPITPLLVGRPGSGRSTVVEELAARIAAAPEGSVLAGVPVVMLDPTIPYANGAHFRLDDALAEITTPTVICVEDVELLLEVSNFGINGAALKTLRRAVDDANARLVLTIDESLLGILGRVEPEFVASLAQIDVQLVDVEEITSIVAGAAEELAEAHGVTIDPAVVRAAGATRSSATGQAQPGLGVSAIDSACVRALLRGSATVEVPDLRSDDPSATRIDFAGLSARLKDSVVGQDQVVDRAARRIALTKAGLDLRPERPDGVFLFVGPTGVGKTEMAKAISREVFGSADRMIRLDMSEYVHDWAISRLIGPQPGYVGSTEPGSWLTTRVMKQPGSVVLLDEIEKAHPLVWNTFLQVFDAGRLTDSRGETADFSRTIIIMTSNLGAEAYSKRNMGFGAQTSSVDEAEASVSETIRRSLSPELINRLDDILMFRPLEAEHIRSIAEAIVDEQVQRIAGLGYRLTVGPEIVDHLAVAGYDPAFGARHLQRNVDRQLLEPLAVAGEGSSFTAVLEDGTIRWEASS